MAQPQVLVPANAAKPVGPYSPGLSTSAYVYVSGQGALDAASKMPEGIEAQTRQCLENVKAILTAGGLTMEHVVAAQVYLLDLANLPAADKVYAEYFPKNAPARVTLGTAKMPVGTPVEITVVAVKDLAARKIVPGGVQVGDRLYLNAVYGSDRNDASAKLKQALRAAGFQGKDVVWENRYEVGPASGKRIPMNALPDGAKAAIFAVASKKALRGKSCIVDGDTAFCEVRAAKPKGTIEEQTAEVFEKTKAGLEQAGFALEGAVATNVYLANIDEFQKMNAKYATYFPGNRPTRTTVQPAATGGPGFRLAVVAVK